VLGSAPAEAKIHPCLELSGELGTILDELGDAGVVQVMIEGGADVAGRFHSAGLVDRYVLYLAPAFMGGGSGTPLLGGDGAATISDLARGRVESVEQLGDDLKIVVTVKSTVERPPSDGSSPAKLT
jgi:diaminohydroxyphosphoribosylaminopyrimidine deaminase/5-amino-6-(5-phosphoribosylamino)uracil reductase